MLRCVVITVDFFLSALSALVAASYEEDRYGVVQKVSSSTAMVMVRVTQILSQVLVLYLSLSFADTFNIQLKELNALLILDTTSASQVQSDDTMRPRYSKQE